MNRVQNNAIERRRVWTAKRLRIQMGILACVVWLGPAAIQAEVINRIVATVDGAPITSHEMQGFRAVADASPMAPAGGAAGMSDNDVLDALIMQKLIRKEVEKQGLKAKQTDIDGYIARIQAQSNFNDEEFEAALHEQGMSMAAYRERVAVEVEQAMLMSREIGSRVNVTPEDVQRYYDEHIDEYTQPAQIRIRHIFRPLSPAASEREEQETLELVHQVRQRALAGTNFGNLASQYSLGPGAESGGDLGYFERGQMPEGIEQVAFSLENGDISQPFRTNSGMHLLKVEDKRNAGLQPLETVSEEIKNNLYNEALRVRYARWFNEDLRFRHHVENFLEVSEDFGSGLTETSGVLETEVEEVAPDRLEVGKKKGVLGWLWPF